MPVTIQVNGTVNTLVHKMSNGISTATLPDVCKTPSPGGPVPVPYPNIAQSITLSSGTTNVKGDKMMAAVKGSKFALSNGDNAGVAGGVKSSTFMKEATWILYSFDVKLQKKNASRLTDKMFHNAENAANLTGEIQGTATAAFADELGDKAMADKLCDAACKAMDDKKKADAKALAKARAGKKKAPAPTKFQKFMRDRLDPKPRGSTPNILTEVGQRIFKGAQEFIGRWGPAIGGKFVKWDIVITHAAETARKSLKWAHVKKIVEVKFPGDELTGNQEKMMQKMQGKRKIITMNVEDDCKCTTKS